MSHRYSAKCERCHADRFGFSPLGRGIPDRLDTLTWMSPEQAAAGRQTALAASFPNGERVHRAALSAALDFWEPGGLHAGAAAARGLPQT